MNKLTKIIIASVITLSLAGCAPVIDPSTQTPDATASTNISNSSSESTYSKVISTSNESTDRSSATPSEKPNTYIGADTLESILEDIQNDFDTTIKHLTDELGKTYTLVGDTFDSYVANKGALNDWYNLVNIESVELFDRTLEKARQYYKLAVNTVDLDSWKAIDKATDKLYDIVYDDAFDDYYDEIYDDAFDDLYDDYYDGIIDDAYDTVAYKVWLQARSDCYSTWLENHSTVYRTWLEYHSQFYREWLDIRSAFLKGNFDVDSILSASLLE